MNAEDIAHNLENGRNCHGGYGDIIGGKPTGAVRISFGYMTTRQEIEQFVAFLSEEFIESRPSSSFQVAERGYETSDSAHTVVPFVMK
jgi:molybdenum cofactor sulfurtransferase